MIRTTDPENNITILENHNRGWYSGTFGWIDNQFNSHFIVGIRSGIIKKDCLNIYAGCGITKDSNPVDEYKESGSHEVPWNASSHSSGIYFYRLVIGETYLQKKMILLR